MEVFSLLNAIRLGGLRDYVMRCGGADKILHFGSKTTQQLSIEIGFENGKRKYNIDLAPNDADGMFPSNENVYTSVKQETIPDYPSPTLYALFGREGEAGIYNSKERSGAIHLRSGTSSSLAIIPFPRHQRVVAHKEDCGRR